MRQIDRKKNLREKDVVVAKPVLRDPSPPPANDNRQALRLVCDSLRNIAEDMCGCNRMRLDDEIRRLEAIAG